MKYVTILALQKGKPQENPIIGRQGWWARVEEEYDEDIEEDDKNKELVHIQWDRGVDEDLGNIEM